MDHLCDTGENITFHCVCPNYSNYVSTLQDITKPVNCNACNTPTDVSNPSNMNFFAMIDPSDAVRDYIETHEDYYDYVVRERKHEKNIIKDIYDGKLYRKFVQKLPACERYSYVTEMFN